MQITALAGGVGGARFLRGLLQHLDSAGSGDPAGAGLADDVTVTVIGNTGDDITLFGLRVCPDLDTLMYTLGGVVDEQQGWGRAEESGRVQAELAAYRAHPQWFTLGDLDFAAHIARSQWLGQGMTLSQVTERLAARWGLTPPRLRLLPMTDQPVETHVVVDEGDGPRAVHFQEWWVRMHAGITAQRFAVVGMDRAVAAPGVLDAIRQADLVLLPPSNPVVSIGIILTVPGIRDALRGTPAPVVGVCPLVAGAPVRGYADACLRAIGLPATAEAVAGLYRDFLDGWVLDPRDAQGVSWPDTLSVLPRDVLMPDPAAAADLAGACLQLGRQLRRSPVR